jgi:hypothetical protein
VAQTTKVINVSSQGNLKTYQRYSSDNGVLLNRNQDTLLLCLLAKAGSFVEPATVKHINYSAFDGCAGISSITLPNSRIFVEWKNINCKFTQSER